MEFLNCSCLSRLISFEATTYIEQHKAATLIEKMINTNLILIGTFLRGSFIRFPLSDGDYELNDQGIDVVILGCVARVQPFAVILEFDTVRVAQRAAEKGFQAIDLVALDVRVGPIADELPVSVVAVFERGLGFGVPLAVQLLPRLELDLIPSEVIVVFIGIAKAVQFNPQAKA